MASAAPSSKSSEMRVLKALRRKPITSRLMTRKMTVPRRIVAIVCRMEVSIVEEEEEEWSEV
jgi:hypothetical protein